MLLVVVLCEPRAHYWVIVSETDFEGPAIPRGVLLYYVAKSNRNKRARFDAGYGKRALAVAQVPEYRCWFGVYKRAALSLSRSRMQYGPGARYVRPMISIITLLYYCCQSIFTPKQVFTFPRKNHVISKREKNYDHAEKKTGERIFRDWITSAERDLSGKVYIQDRPIPRESRSSLTRIRYARDKQESFDACLREGRKRGYAILRWLYIARECAQPMTLAETISGLLR